MRGRGAAVKKVLVAMSGGVDSSVAALLLKEQGLEVVGVTMCLGLGQEGGRGVRCCGPREIEDAGRVCRTLGINHYVVDFAADLEEKVIRPFVEEYGRGRTPNPCIECNRALKFDALLKRAVAWGFDAIATGHYARIERGESGCRLVRPKDRRKDQTYFLYAVDREALKKVLFPLADLTKQEVRRLAEAAGLPVFAKAESQDICFLPAGARDAFLRERGIGLAEGEIVDERGFVRGRHRGVACYTVGQRGGLGISAPEPLYVLRIDAAENRLVVGPKGSLGAASLTAGRVRSLVDEFPPEGFAKIRYSHRPAACRIGFDGERLTVRFAEPQEAVAPGQSVVLYEGDTVLGGGIIEEAHRGVD